MSYIIALSDLRQMHDDAQNVKVNTARRNDKDLQNPSKMIM